MKSDRTPIYMPLAIGIAILAVSTASILIRLAQQDAPSITIAALRLTFATLVLAPVVLSAESHGAGASLAREQLALGADLRRVPGSALRNLDNLTANTPASPVRWCSSAPDRFGLRYCRPLVLRERLGAAAVAGLGLAVMGGMIIAANDSCSWQGGLRCSGFGTTPQGASLWGNFLALLGAFAVSGYLMIGRRLRQSCRSSPYIFLVYGCAAVVLLITAAATDSLVLALPGRTYLWIILLALGASAHRALNLQLGTQVPAGGGRGRHDTGRTGWVGRTGVLHPARATGGIRTGGRSADPGRHLCRRSRARTSCGLSQLSASGQPTAASIQHHIRVPGPLGGLD